MCVQDQHWSGCKTDTLKLLAPRAPSVSKWSQEQRRSRVQASMHRSLAKVSATTISECRNTSLFTWLGLTCMQIHENPTAGYFLSIINPWTPKPWKMKVLHTKLWVITPKNEGCGFPWNIITIYCWFCKGPESSRILMTLQQFKQQGHSTHLNKFKGKITTCQTYWIRNKPENYV